MIIKINVVQCTNCLCIQSKWLSERTCGVLLKLGVFSFRFFMRAQIIYYKSSAVAKRQRDASCRSVVSFVASIVLKCSFFIISYFSFGFTSAYNSILFCCLQRNVTPCCHTYDLSWLCIVWERAWSLSRGRTTETVTLSRVALGGRIPAVYDQRYKCHNWRDGGRRPPATMFTSPRLLEGQRQAYRLRIAISAYPTCIRCPR